MILNQIHAILSFENWYDYAFLLIWLILLMLGLNYYEILESRFKPNRDVAKGRKQGVWILSASFVLGLLQFLVQIINPQDQDPSSFSLASILSYAVYGSLLLVLIVNVYQSYSQYTGSSRILRACILTVLIGLYYFSGFLGGLMVVGVIALVVLIYVFIKFKKILSIK